MRVLRLTVCAAGVILSILCVLGSLGCDDDPASPPASGTPDYHVYYDYDGLATRPQFMVAYSTKTFEPVDTIDGAFRDFLFTSDGKYMVAREGSSISLVEMATRRTMATDTGARSYVLSLSPDEKYVLSGKEESSELRVYELSRLSRLWSDSLTWPVAEFLSSSGKIVYAVTDIDTFFVVNFVDVLDSPEKLHGGTGFFPRVMALNKSLQQLFVIGKTDTDLSQLRIYDANDLKQLKAIRVPDNFRLARILFTSDGTNAYLSSPLTSSGSPAGILRYDCTNESLEWFIDGSRFVTPRFTPQDIQLTPDGELFCALSQSGIGPGNVFIFNARTGELLKVLYHKGGLGWHIRMYPLPT